MPSSRRTAAMPLLLLAFTATANALNAMTYKGCYSSSKGLADQGSYQYQTSGYCQPICVGKGASVLGLSNGSDCWCGGELPPANSLVDDSKCSTPCNGFGKESCGAANYYSVWLTGVSNDVVNAAADNVSPTDTSSSSASSTSTSSSTTSSSPTTTEAAVPVVVTSVSPGNTVVVTVSASATAAPSGSSSGSSSTSVAGIAAGVVVGVLAIAGIIGGVFFWLRHRQRQRAEQDYKRSAQVADFMRGERKAPDTAYSQMSDSRLDPEIGRRNSVGSMADEHDYSRRILRVANPDSH